MLTKDEYYEFRDAFSDKTETFKTEYNIILGVNPSGSVFALKQCQLMQERRFLPKLIKRKVIQK